MNLFDQGFRFMVNHQTGACRWTHPAEVHALDSTWIDSTDMSEQEFEDFISNSPAYRINHVQ